MPVPKYKSDFEMPSEGLYLFQIESCEFKTGEKGLSAEVKSKTVQSPTSPDLNMIVTDFFALYSEFGMSKFLGLAVKAIDLPSKDDKGNDKDYPMNYFEDTNKQKKMMKVMPSSLFGGEIKHTTQAKKGGKEGEKSTFANIKEYFSKAEYAEEAKKAKAAPAAAGIAAGATDQTNLPGTGGETGDGW